MQWTVSRTEYKVSRIIWALGTVGAIGWGILTDTVAGDIVAVWGCFMFVFYGLFLPCPYSRLPKAEPKKEGKTGQ